MNNIISRIKVPLYQKQLDRVNNSILNGELVNGKDLEEFEIKLKEQFNRKYVLLSSNGFSAIFLTLLAIDNKKKEVILPAISTCFSMVNATKMAGYKIKFCDVDLESMSLGSIDDSSSIVLSPNHFGKIASYNRNHNRKFTIEDSCQSFLSSRNIKNSTDVTILSFYPSKLINGIDGGAILTDNREIYEQAQSMVYYAEQNNFEEQGSFNMRLNNINASFALATMEHIDEIETRLKEIYEEISHELKTKGIKFLKMEESEVASKFILIFPDRKERDSVFDSFLKDGIEVSLEFIFIAPEKDQDRYKNARILVDTTLSIPFHPLLTTDELIKIKKRIRCI